jgi:hypothetical protein
MAVHPETTGRRQRITDPVHFHGIAGLARPASAAEPTANATAELLRPLAEYERAVGGGWA